MLLEVCAGSLSSALAAQEGGAHRIELCDNLSEGGTTPSAGTVLQAVKLLNIPVFVLIRPRTGDFLYSDKEFDVMKDDIAFCKEHGAKGVVLGLLKTDGNVDLKRTSELMKLARPMEVTFHRAFDMSSNPVQAMEDIINLGIDRILTSGQAVTAPEGAGLISGLIRQATGRIIIMPGGGINEINVTDLIAITGATEIHASLRSMLQSKMQFRNTNATMGKQGKDEYSRMETDPDRVMQMIRILNLSSKYSN
jgi:copper homeostasis protein